MTTGITNYPGLADPNAASQILPALNEAASRAAATAKPKRGTRTTAVPVTLAELALVAELSCAESISDTMGLERADDGGLDLITLITLVREKVDQNQMSFTAENVKRIQEQQAKAAEERMAKAREARLEIAEAKSSGFLSKALSWIGAALMIVVGAATLALGGAGGVMLAGGIAMTAMLIMAETGGTSALLNGLAEVFEAMGVSSEVAHGIATYIVVQIIAAAAVVAFATTGPLGAVAVAASLSNMVTSPENLQSMGMSKEAATWTSLGCTIAALVVSIGAGFASTAKGAAKTAADVSTGLKAVDKTADTAATAKKVVEAAEAAENVGKSLVESTLKYAPNIQLGIARMGMVGSFAQAVTAFAGGCISMRITCSNRDATYAQADSKRFEATVSFLEQKVTEEAQRIKDISNAITERIDILMDILDQAYASQRRILAV